jgi:hypothetical protein
VEETRCPFPIRFLRDKNLCVTWTESSAVVQLTVGHEFSKKLNMIAKLAVVHFDLKVSMSENLPMFNTGCTSQNWPNYFCMDYAFRGNS